MRKTVIDPDAGKESVTDVEGVENAAFSRGVVIERAGYTRVWLSGVTAPGDQHLEAQTRQVLGQIERYLEQVGGTMDDVVSMTIYLDGVADDELEELHVARDEFFEREHYPANSLVWVESLNRGNVEIEVEAVVPDDGWETDEVAGAEGGE